MLNENGNVVDRCESGHDDTTEMSEYFRTIGRDGMAAVSATRNWYRMVELPEECGLAAKLTRPQKVRLNAEPGVKPDKDDAKTPAHLERTGFLPGREGSLSCS